MLEEKHLAIRKRPGILATIGSVIKNAFFPTLSRVERGEHVTGVGAYYGHNPYDIFYGPNSDGSKWPYGLSTTGAAPVLDHFMIRQNARSAFHDSVQARAIVERYADVVVDQGLKLEATPKADILKISPEQAEEWSEQVNESFDAWCNDRKVTRNETMNFYQLQRMVEVFQQRDGDYFVRFYYSPRKDLQNPLQIGFIDPNQIRGTAITNTYGYDVSNDGIIRNAAGKEIGYKIWIFEDNKYKEVVVPAYGPKSKKRFMIHGFQPEYAFQGRGYSRLAHALQEFENITDFTAAQIKKAINQSSIVMFNKPSKDNAASNPLDGISHSVGAGPAGLLNQETIETDDGTEIPIDQWVKYIPIPEATLATPGSVGVFNLQEGEELKPFGQTAPADSFNTFVESFTSYLAASMSIPIEVLLMKFNQNYSASRGALILFWRVAQIWRSELSSDLLNPVYEEWLAGEIAAGRVKAPGWNDPRLRAAWLCNNWIGAPMPNIDPMKTAVADQRYAELGAQTLDRISRNLNGSSGKANRAKLAREFTELPPSPFNKKGNN